jgi:hypothetical protein
LLLRREAAEVANWIEVLGCGTIWPEGAIAVPQMAKYRCLSPQVKREPQHLVYSMQIRGGGPQTPDFRLRKTPEGLIDAGFNPFHNAFGHLH